MNPDLKQKILSLLSEHRIMTIATLRPDGWPQATTVGYVSEDMTLWFLCGLESQKAANLARDSRASITIDHDTPDLLAITGLSMAAHVVEVRDSVEAARVIALMPLKYPEAAAAPPFPMPTPDQVKIFKVTPIVISVLDYTKGFGHAELVKC